MVNVFEALDSTLRSMDPDTLALAGVIFFVAMIVLAMIVARAIEYWTDKKHPEIKREAETREMIGECLYLWAIARAQARLDVAMEAHDKEMASLRENISVMEAQLGLRQTFTGVSK